MMKFIPFLFTGKKVIRVLRNGTIFVTDPEGTVSRYQRVETPKSATKKRATQKSKATAKNSVPKLAKTVSRMEMCTVRLERLTESSIDKLQAMVKRQHQLRAVKANISALPCKLFFLSNFSFVRCYSWYSLRFKLRIIINTHSFLPFQCLKSHVLCQLFNVMTQ